jgi:hypothetical protein
LSARILEFVRWCEIADAVRRLLAPAWFVICVTEEEAIMTDEQSAAHDWLRIIQAEYLEMPGLHLTKPQVQRLWRLDPHTCDSILQQLVAAEFLKKTPSDAYMLASLDR